MKKEKQVYRTEIRLNSTLYDAVKGISDELGCSMNCAMCMLIENGYKGYVSPFTVRNHIPAGE